MSDSKGAGPRRRGGLDRQIADLKAQRAHYSDRVAELTGTDRAAQVLADAREKMGKHGVAVISVGDGGDGEHVFSYTVGMTRRRHPELIVTGLPTGTAQEVLNNAARLVLDGRRLVAGDRLDGILDGYQVVIAGPVSPVGNEAYKIKVAWQVFANPGRPLQVVYPDSGSRFPWEPGYSMTTQPLLAPAPA